MNRFVVLTTRSVRLIASRSIFQCRVFLPSQRCFSTNVSQEKPVEEKANSSKFSSSANGTEIPIEKEVDVRTRIFQESLRFVDEKGWTLDAIRAGIRASNQSSTLEGLFNNGYDLVEYFILDSNEKMCRFIEEKRKENQLQGGQLLVEALKYRLSLVIPYARTWDQALAQGALPRNAVRGWKGILDLASAAWHGIGDKSSDINWYTKRLIVAGIYKSAEIYMIQDSSIDKNETLQFLERRLNDFQTFGTVKNSVSKSVSDTTQLASGLFSVVRNLTSRR